MQEDKKMSIFNEINEQSNDIELKHNIIEGNMCIFTTQNNKKHIGLVESLDCEFNRALVSYTIDIDPNLGEIRIESWLMLTEIKKYTSNVTQSQVNSQSCVLAYIPIEGIVKGKIIHENEDGTYELVYYQILEDGRIERLLVSDVSLANIVEVEKTDNICPIHIDDFVYFTRYNKREMLGKVIYICDDECVDIEYEYMDAFGNKLTKCEYLVNLKYLRVKMGGRYPLCYTEFISDQQQKDIDDNKKIYNSFDDEDVCFENKTFSNNNILYQHQQAGVVLAEKYNRFAFYFDKGIGKKVMMLDIIKKKEKNNARFLVITSKFNANVRWMEEASRFYPSLRILSLCKELTEREKRKLVFSWEYGVEVPSDSVFIDLINAIADKEDKEPNESAKHFIITPDEFVFNSHYYITEYGVNGIIIEGDAILKEQNILAKAAKLGIRSIGIPAISTNRYGFPEHRAAFIAVDVCMAFANKYPGYIDSIKFVLFDPKSVDAYQLIIKHAEKKADELIEIGKCCKCGKQMHITKAEFVDIVRYHDGKIGNTCKDCE